MKLGLKNFSKWSKHRKIFALGLISLASIIISGLSVKTLLAADVNTSLSLGSLPGVFRFQKNGQASCSGIKYGFCLNNSIFLEISQAGNGNSLNSLEAWTKSYIEPNRLNSAVIGIYDGQYAGSGGSNSEEFDSNRTRNVFSDTGATRFEFYTAQDFSRSNNEIDERPCLVAGKEKPFLTISSRDMTKKSWRQIDVSNALNSNLDPACTAVNANKGLVTQKTNRIVIFIKAVWVDPNNTEGRVNAFKVGTAYTDKSNDLENTGLTGYYSRYVTATNSMNDIPANQASVGQYAIQNRVDSDGTQGRYYFGFAPDCRLAPGETETRYIRWKDVDYPNFYGGLDAPRFRLVDVTNPSNVRVVKDVDGNDLDLSGAQLGGPNQTRERRAVFTGGRIYEWHWYNVVARDGIVFWIPFDDFPALVGGCGEWRHQLELRAGASAVGTTDFRAYGGQTVAANLNQVWSGKDPGPNTTVQLNLASDNGNSFNSTFESLSTTLGGSSTIANTNLRQITWDNLARLGPPGAYNSSRPDLFAYFKVRENAPDGARYCFTASMTPGSNASPGSINSVPARICVTIDNSLRPFVGTSGADVHAGSCNLETGSTKSITGQISPSGARGSSGSYVVSAGGSINGFGSGGSPVGTGLTLGKNGRYGPMCRPSEQAMKTEFDKDKATEVVWTNSTTLDLGSLPAGRVKVTMPGGGSITGTARGPVTIYSPGTVTITGATVGAGSDAASRTNLPVVGVIARNIAIQNNVTTLNAILYATGNIDTCSNVANWSDSGFAGCRSTLTLNGFAVARDFSFKRISAATSGVQAGEQLNFNAAFYLNPPPGFGTAAGAVRYLGERTPLY